MGEGSLFNLGLNLAGLTLRDKNLLIDKDLIKQDKTLLDALKEYDIKGNLFKDVKDANELGLDYGPVSEFLAIFKYAQEHKDFIYDFRSIPKEGDANIVDKKALKEKIDQGEKALKGIKESEDGQDVLVSDSYVIPQELTKFKESLKQAKETFDNAKATKEQVDQSTKDLEQAIKTFEENKKPGLKEPLNKKPLEEALAEADKSIENILVAEDASKVLKGKDFVNQEDLDVYKAVINKARALLSSDTVEQKELDQAVENLKDALNAFKGKIQKGTKDALDKEALKEKVAQAKEAMKDVAKGTDPAEIAYGKQFTSPEAFAALEAVLSNAQKLLENPEASHSEGDQMIQDLDKALKTFNDSLKKGAKLSDGVYFQKDSGEIIQMDENKTFTLTALDQGRFIVKGENFKPDWDAYEDVKVPGQGSTKHYWISADGRFKPLKNKTVDAKVKNENNYNESYQFKIKQVPSQIEELKIYVNGQEASVDNPVTMEGTSDKTITVKGRKKGNDYFQSIPYQALDHDARGQGNQKRIRPNWTFQIKTDPITYTIFLTENPDVKASFKAVPKHVPVKGINIRAPKKFYIHDWNGIFGDYYVGIQRGNAANQYMESFTPTNASNRNLIWEALTPEIAEFMEVHKNGIVPKKAGLAKFKVISEDNPEVFTTVEVEFAYKNPLKSAQADKKIYEMEAGDQERFQINVNPTDASEQRFHWTYDKEGIVTVKDEVKTDPASVLIPKETIHYITAKNDGVVKVTGTPYDQTGGAKPVEFTVVVGDVSLPVDKAMLNAAIEKVSKQPKANVTSRDGKDVAKDKTWVTPEAQEALDLALKNAKKINSDPQVEQATIDRAAELLNQAIENYNPLPGTRDDSSVVDKSSLEKAITKAKDSKADTVSKDGKDVAKDKTWVTPEAQKALDTALEKAKAVQKEAKATQDEVNKATEDLTKALESYKPVKGTKEDTPSTPDEPDKPDKPVQPEKPSKPDRKDPPQIIIPWLPGIVDLPKPSQPKVQEPKKEEPKQEDKKEENHVRTFTDIRGHWAEKVILEVVKKGYFTGTSTTTFSPNKTTTRAEFVTVLGRLAKIDPSKVGESNFKDVKDGAYYTAYLVWATKEGLVTGTGDGKFSPDREITREEVATILARYLKSQGKLVEASKEPVYKDQDQISDWAKDAVARLTEAGIFKGKDQGFAPKDQLTRAEYAQLIYNMDLR